MIHPHNTDCIEKYEEKIKMIPNPTIQKYKSLTVTVNYSGYHFMPIVDKG